MCLSVLLSVNVFAASWPSLTTSAYCEFKAPKQINMYKDSGLKTRGTCSPSKSYNAYISKNDICKIYEITGSYIKAEYPTSSGNRIGFFKRSDLIGVSSPSEKISSKSTATIYMTPNGSSYGTVEVGDEVYACGTSSGYTAVFYSAKSGSRAYKFGWLTSNDYSKVKNSGSSNNNGSLLFPIKGSITRSSERKTNGQYCDYRTGGSVALYAPADGTVAYKQAYRNNKNGKQLSSYGNYIVFTSSSGGYTVKCCHLSSFNGVDCNVKSSMAYPCSGSDGTLTLKTNSVKKGELLGYTGHTGNASAHHLHLEITQNGKALNPANAFTSWN